MEPLMVIGAGTLFGVGLFWLIFYLVALFCKPGWSMYTTIPAPPMPTNTMGVKRGDGEKDQTPHQRG